MAIQLNNWFIYHYVCDINKLSFLHSKFIEYIYRQKHIPAGLDILK